MASGLYRITQESLQNVAKHAKAKHLSVTLGVRDDNLVLSLEDDGIGFAPQAVKGKGGLGLVSIGERARIIGGTLALQSFDECHFPPARNSALMKFNPLSVQAAWARFTVPAICVSTEPSRSRSADSSF